MSVALRPFHRRAQCRKIVGMLGELGAVAAAKFDKARRIVTVPFPQSRRRCDLAWPSVDFQFRFGQPARPQAVDEDAHSVLRARPVISALDRDR
jgi:hypothetical protein